jgi:gluconate kinase
MPPLADSLKKNYLSALAASVILTLFIYIYIYFYIIKRRFSENFNYFLKN